MRLTRFYLISRGMLLLLALILVGCSSGSGETSTPIKNSPTRVVAIQTASRQKVSIRTATGSSAIDSLVAQILANMHLHAWNPHAMSHTTMTGGLYINWKITDPSITNVTNPGADGDTDHNHDPQVDLLYLLSLAEYHQLHPQDHSYDGDLSRATSLVLADFKTYGTPKGWIYFSLLKAGTLLNNSDLVNTAHNFVNNFYKRSYDPTLGFVYNRGTQTPVVYNTDHTLVAGAALIDAGIHWNNQDWVDAGEKTIDHTIAVALNPQYHFFYYSMVVSSDGHDKIGNYKAKAGIQGQMADALLTAYTLTHRQQYLDVATQMIQAMFGSSGMWDKSLGGFFYAFDLQKGAPVTGYKETRGQSLMLLAIQHYNQIMQQQYAQQEQQVVDVLTNHFYQRDYHGYVYRMTPDFQIFVNTAKSGNTVGAEDYFTTEAMGGAMDALQRTELG